MLKPLSILAVIVAVVLMLAGANLMQTGATGTDTLSGLLLAWGGLSLVVVVVIWPAVSRRL